MATIIRHGPNGSYKSAMAVWFDLVPALREGRICITNVEGLSPLNEIEERLGEKFPDSTRLFRISSLTEKGLRLWRRFFHWAPCGAFILMDEIQDIYPEGSMKEEALNLQPIEVYEKHLPAGFVELFYEVLDKLKPEHFDSSHIDDTGELLFDERGHIRYPQTLNGAFKRHRKFNWDIICCTPDITDVSRIVRGCAELAYAHSNKDSFILTRRSPRIYEHNPKQNGIPSPRDTVYRKKVPLAVFKIYKSTQTGSNSKSGWARGPFSSPVLYIYLVLFFGFLFWALSDWSSSSSDTPSVAPSPGETVNSDSSGKPAADNAQAGHPVATPVSNALDARQAVFVNPYEALQVFITGSSLDTQGNGVVLLSLITKDGEYHTNNDELFAMGYAVRFIRYCQAQLLHVETGASRLVHCQPSRYEQPKPTTEQPEAQALEGITIAADTKRERPD
ncbi:zonular occludens toxin domain-containing protein [Aeromonas veronii]|uniref:zonular occludens toxin domain-containing protein n=1 Tax=Aeromonas veronii TaxID=654 RepID=UPI003D24879C